jgi:hypothetical protein
MDMVYMAEPTFSTEEPELATVWGLSEKFSIAETEDRTLILLSESYSRGTGCRGLKVRKLGMSGSVGAPGR